MVAENLLDALVEDTREILKDIRLKDPNGKLSKVNVFPQYLPIQPPYRLQQEDIPPEVVEEGLAASDVNTIPDPFPYVIVRVNQGVIEGIDEEQAVEVFYLIGVYDDNLNNQGYRDVMDIIQRIYERFAKRTLVAKKYVCDTSRIEWTLQEEESYPYYFGGMTLNFNTIPIVREDPYT